MIAALAGQLPAYARIVALPKASQAKASRPSALAAAAAKARQRPPAASQNGTSNARCGLMISAPSSAPAVRGRLSSRATPPTSSAPVTKPFCACPAAISAPGKTSTSGHSRGKVLIPAQAHAAQVTATQAIHAAGAVSSPKGAVTNRNGGGLTKAY